MITTPANHTEDAGILLRIKINHQGSKGVVIWVLVGGVIHRIVNEG